MYEEQWGEIVEDWLWEDQKLKRKDRRTNRRTKRTGVPSLRYCLEQVWPATECLTN